MKILSVLACALAFSLASCRQETIVPMYSDCKLSAMQTSFNAFAFEYDGARLSTVRYAGMRVAFEYDRQERVTQANYYQDNGKWTLYDVFEYGNNGQVKKRRFSNIGTYFSDNSFVQEFVLDAQGRVSTLKASSTEIYRYEYDAAGNVSKVFLQKTGEAEVLQASYTKYDTQKNPFSHFSWAVAATLFPTNSPAWGEWLNQNNWVSKRNQAGDILHRSYTYGKGDRPIFSYVFPQNEEVVYAYDCK